MAGKIDSTFICSLVGLVITALWISGICLSWSQKALVDLGEFLVGGDLFAEFLLLCVYWTCPTTGCHFRYLGCRFPCPLGQSSSMLGLLTVLILPNERWCALAPAAG